MSKQEMQAISTAILELALSCQHTEPSDPLADVNCTLCERVLGERVAQADAQTVAWTIHLTLHILFDRFPQMSADNGAISLYGVDLSIPEDADGVKWCLCGALLARANPTTGPFYGWERWACPNGHELGERDINVGWEPPAQEARDG